MCETHYHQLYRQLHTLAPCAGCGKTPKARERPYYRHSPDADSVTAYFLERGLEGRFSPADTLCKACYNLHLVLLKKQHHRVPDLKGAISAWREEATDDKTTPLTEAVLGCVIYVANQLHQDKGNSTSTSHHRLFGFLLTGGERATVPRVANL